VFYAYKEGINIWEKCLKAFVEKFFLVGRTSALRGKITNFQQQKGETIPDAWGHYQQYYLHY